MLALPLMGAFSSLHEICQPQSSLLHVNMLLWSLRYNLEADCIPCLVRYSICLWTQADKN